jgi:hypothetical protein
MKAVFVALVLGVCALAYGIGVAWADTGSSAAAPSQTAPATQPVQQDEQGQEDQSRPRDDCPEKDGGGSGSSGSQGSEQNL